MGSQSSEFPSSLGAQFRRNIVLYACGAVLLGAQQFLMAQRDFLVKAAVDAADARIKEAAATAALWMLAVSISAAIMRVLSRVTMFTGGRNVEYELRAVLLGRLHKLGPSFFRKMPTGEIMSRATNDLTQVRLLLGFGIMNIIGSAFALASALYVMVRMNNRAWSATSFPGVRITCAMRFRSYLRLQVVNVLLTLLTLGLFRPFAAVRTWRYRVAHVTVDAPDGFEQAVLAARRPAVAAAGDGIADFLGADLSW